ncbi:MAG: alpha-glucosidase [Clostridia bacterium]|nr:alpha-glucosidase [Clostridia bacterium]
MRKHLTLWLAVLTAVCALLPAAAESTAPHAWWQDTIVYQIYPMSFQDTDANGYGDLRGIDSRLDYLASLGVGAIWLTPVYVSPMVDNGYDVADYTDIDPLYGTMDDMKQLIADADARGIRIVMDLVVNHTSDRHPWFLESASGRDNPKSDWYIWRDAKEDGSAPNNWRGIFGGSAWTWCEARGQYYLHTFAVQQPDLNWENPEVRQAIADAANFWLDMGVGGFRVDAVPYIKKPAGFADGEPDGEDGMTGIHAMTANTEGILDFLREFRERTVAGRDVFTVGEANGVQAADLPDWVGEHGVFDMIFEFSHVDIGNGTAHTWSDPAPWTLTDLKGAFSASQAATRDSGWYPVFLENHDQPRSVDHFLPDAEDSVLAAKLLGTLVVTMRGTPFIFEGQELGYTNVAWDNLSLYNDLNTRAQYDFAIQEGFTPEQALEGVHRFSRDNARTPMQWDGGENASFTAGTPWLPVHDDYAEVNVAAETADAHSVLNWYRTLSALRADSPEFLYGDYEELFPGSEEIFAYRRTAGDGQMVVLLNFTEAPVTYDASVVDGMIPVVSSYSASEAGLLQPLEAVIWH